MPQTPTTSHWDDQVLLVSGKRLRGKHKLAKGSRATITQPHHGFSEEGDELMMGVVFSEDSTSDRYGTSSFVLTIGKKPDLGVTEAYTHGELPVRYTVSDQTPWSMTLEFRDA